MKNDLFDQLKQSLEEDRKIRRGAIKTGRIFKVDTPNDIVKIRCELGLSQSKFAGVVGVSVNTLQNWEQGRRDPSGPAKVLLKIVASHPEVLLENARMVRSIQPSSRRVAARH